MNQQQEPIKDARGVPIEVGAFVVCRLRKQALFGQVIDTKKMVKVQTGNGEHSWSWINRTDCIVVIEVPYVSGKFNGIDRS